MKKSVKRTLSLLLAALLTVTAFSCAKAETPSSKAARMLIVFFI